VSTSLVAVVLGAGQGTRMKSRVPKVLHRVCDRPMLAWVVSAVTGLHRETPVAEIVVVVGHHADEVTACVKSMDSPVPLRVVLQPEQLGTGDAVRCALGKVASTSSAVLVLPGDMPLIQVETLRRMAEAHEREHAQSTLLTARFADPAGYGRVVRDAQGAVLRIVEHADASPVERKLNEVVVSAYMFDQKCLRSEIADLASDNAQGELYLPDVIEQMASRLACVETGEEEVQGVNDRVHLATVEHAMRRRLNEYWMRQGVTMRDPAATYVGGAVELSADVELLPGCHLEGTTRIGEGSLLGPDTRVIDSVIGPDCSLSYCVVREAELAAGVQVGPYASLRGGSTLASDTHIGSFVETKCARVGAGSKIPHLSYVGDAVIGEDVNLGANTITCNWDGIAKHETVVEDGARTGTGTRMVAPVTIGRHAYTGAGAIVTRDVPPGSLAKGMPARHEEGWVERNRPGVLQGSLSKNLVEDLVEDLADQ